MDPAILETVADATIAIHASRDKADLLHALCVGLDSLGFESFKFGCHKLNKYELVLNPTLTNWPDDLMVEYDRRNWADRDPILARAVIDERPFTWSVRNRYSDRLQQSYIDYLHSTPLRGGLVLPLNSRPGFISSISVEAYSDRQVCAEMVPAVSIVANAAMLKSELLGLCPEVRTVAPEALKALSGQQIEILQWASKGKSNADIASILSLSERIVKYHMGEILRKLEVASRTQAAAVFAMRPMVSVG